MLSAHYIPTTFHIFYHLIFTTTLWGKHYHLPHLSDRITEAWGLKLLTCGYATRKGWVQDLSSESLASEQSYHFILPILSHIICTFKRIEGQVLTLVVLSGGGIMIIPQEPRRLISQQAFISIYCVFGPVLGCKYYRRLRHNCKAQWFENPLKCIKLGNGYKNQGIYVIKWYNNIYKCDIIIYRH